MEAEITPFFLSEIIHSSLQVFLYVFDEQLITFVFQPSLHLIFLFSSFLYFHYSYLNSISYEQKERHNFGNELVFLILIYRSLSLRNQKKLKKPLRKHCELLCFTVICRTPYQCEYLKRIEHTNPKKEMIVFDDTFFLTQPPTSSDNEKKDQSDERLLISKF